MRRETPLAWLALVPAAGLVGALALGAIAGAADEWGPHVSGRHVYDTAHVLSSTQVSDLEAGAAAVDRAGAPTAVYLRVKAADDPATRQDARSLMDAWALETARGARDGFVLLMNLRPGDTGHGAAALVAGARHAGDGRLSDARLQSIYEGTMKPWLARGDLGGALSAALAAVREDLGPPARQATATAAPDKPLTAYAAGDWALVSLGLALVMLPIAGAVLLLGFVIMGIQALVRRGGGWSPSSTIGPTTYSEWPYSPGYTADSTSAGGDSGASSDSSSGGGDF
jgi:uncharacterized membrane protein YgcG